MKAGRDNGLPKKKSISIPKTDSGMNRLIEIVRNLRDPDNGCAWDLAQTNMSILPYTLEEAYEVVEAVENGNANEITDELGDLLFQVIFHSQIAEDIGHFTFNDVINQICSKMIDRHPHIFSNQKEKKTIHQQEKDWETYKMKARKKNSGKKNISIFDGISKSYPAITKAIKIQSRASRVGFDWKDKESVLMKVQEELTELIGALARPKEPLPIQEEFGDLIFTIVNLGRHLRLDPESCLRLANQKFINRFQALELAARKSGQNIEDLSERKLDELWELNKAFERTEN